MTPTTSGPGHLEHDARQAVQAWNIQSTDSIQIALNPIHLIDAGDALAVLVAQLLDQLDAEADQWVTERDALGERCRQLLDELAEAERNKRLVLGLHEGMADEVRTLGERVHQLETALKNIGAIAATNRVSNVPDLVVKAARAALGDPKETDE